MWPPDLAQSGTLHRYSKRFVAFEYFKTSHTPGANLILWVGGLGDGLLTVGYPTPLAHALPPTWGLAQVMLASSYNGFGTSSLSRDARELGQCVEYFRKIKPADSKIVIMGHSTGCQDAMEYLTGQGNEQRPKIDGIILQGSVSDREAMLGSMTKEQHDRAVAYAQEMVATGRWMDVIPASAGITTFGNVPVTAYRWLSLLSPNKDGDDDFFSSDLPDDKLKKTFGSLKKETPLLFLMGGADQFIPKHVDREALVQKWTRIIKEGGGAVDEVNGGVQPGAHHNMEEDDETVIQDLCKRVNGFIARLVNGDFYSISQLHL
jgi:pimeloyl-ACP methyl ester carboxylesterase